MQYLDNADTLSEKLPLYTATLHAQPQSSYMQELKFIMLLAYLKVCFDGNQQGSAVHDKVS